MIPTTYIKRYNHEKIIVISWLALLVLISSITGCATISTKYPEETSTSDIVEKGIGEQPKTSEALFQKALDSLAELEMENTYKLLGRVIQDFPNSEQSKKAKVIKVMISTVELWKARLDDNDLEEWNGYLINDIKAVLPLCGQQIDIELCKKEFRDISTSNPLWSYQYQLGEVVGAVLGFFNIHYSGFYYSSLDYKEYSDTFT